MLVHFGLFPSELRRQHEKWQRGCKQRGQGPRASASQPAPDTAVVIPRKKLLSEKPPLCEAERLFRAVLEGGWMLHRIPGLLRFAVF